MFVIEIVDLTGSHIIAVLSQVRNISAYLMGMIRKKRAGGGREAGGVRDGSSGWH
jgi:hypothetical protein